MCHLTMTDAYLWVMQIESDWCLPVSEWMKVESLMDRLELTNDMDD